MPNADEIVEPTPSCGKANSPLTDDDIGRFWSRVAIAGQDECWLWIGKGRGRFYYGSMSVSRGTAAAHRLSWEIANGRPIPDGLYVLHDPLVCNRPGCVNPRHLRLGTASDNMRDRIRAGNNPFARRVACPKGHPYGRFKVESDGRRHRICTECERARSKRRSAERRLARPINRKDTRLRTLKARANRLQAALAQVHSEIACLEGALP